MEIRNWIKSNERFDMRGDGDGLYLSYREAFAFPIWRFRYRFAGAQRIMNIGSYRDVSLQMLEKFLKSIAHVFHLVMTLRVRSKREGVKLLQKLRLKITLTQWQDWLTSIFRIVY